MGEGDGILFTASARKLGKAARLKIARGIAGRRQQRTLYNDRVDGGQTTTDDYTRLLSSTTHGCMDVVDDLTCAHHLLSTYTAAVRLSLAAEAI